MSKKDLQLSLEPQKIYYNTFQNFNPGKWEMIDGKLFGSDEETFKALKLIAFHLGARRCLDQIPREIIEAYLSEKIQHEREPQIKNKD